MKHNFKKIMSLLLTVVMLLGTVSAVIPFSASAESVPNQNVTVNQDGTVTITPNTDAVYNGVTYRFDVVDANDTNRVATINTDGSVTVTFRYGDMLWFPEVKTDADASVHAEVTALGRGNTTTADGSMGELFFGLGYGIKEDTDGSWASGHTAVMRTIGRTRFADITPALVSAVSGSNYGHQGAGQYVIINPSDQVYGTGATEDNKKDFDKWAHLSFGDGTNSWKIGATWLIDLQMGNENVVGNWGSYNGIYNTTEYATSTRANVEGAYHHQGAVGILPIWLNNAEYITVRLDSLTADGHDVLRGMDFTNITPNSDFDYNGIICRFDVATGHELNSWARVYEDGTWETRMQHGDMLWFPEIKMTETSEIHAVVTNTSGKACDLFSGFAYGVTAGTDGAYETGNAAVVRTAQNSKSRFRLTGISRSGLLSVTGTSLDYGNGGDTRAVNDEAEVLYAGTAWDKVKATNENWASGKSVFYNIAQKGGNVVATFGTPGYGAFVDSSKTQYAANLEGMHPIADGSVGYTIVWQDYDYHWSQFRIDSLTLTNCTVGDDNDEKTVYSVLEGEKKNSKYSLAANLSLDGVIGFNVKVDANYFIKGTETLVVTDKTSTTVVETTLADMWNTDGGYYAYTIPVNAKEMTDTFTVTLKDGETVIATYSNLSVKSYADQLMANDAYNEWDALVTAMLNYGAAAQKLFDYNIEKPAADLTNFDFDMKDVEGNDIGLPTITGTDTTIISNLSASLVLESDTSLKLYFKNETNADLTVTVNYEEAELTDASNGLLCLTISDIAADELDDEFVVSLNDGAFVIRISACEWAKTVVENETDADMITLAKALAAYATAAASKN